MPRKNVVLCREMHLYKYRIHSVQVVFRAVQEIIMENINGFKCASTWAQKLAEVCCVFRLLPAAPGCYVLQVGYWRRQSSIRTPDLKGREIGIGLQKAIENYASIFGPLIFMELLCFLFKKDGKEKKPQTLKAFLFSFQRNPPTIFALAANFWDLLDHLNIYI